MLSYSVLENNGTVTELFFWYLIVMSTHVCSRKYQYVQKKRTVAQKISMMWKTRVHVLTRCLVINVSAVCFTRKAVFLNGGLYSVSSAYKTDMSIEYNRQKHQLSSEISAAHVNTNAV